MNSILPPFTDLTLQWAIQLLQAEGIMPRAMTPLNLQPQMSSMSKPELTLSDMHFWDWAQTNPQYLYICKGP